MGLQYFTSEEIKRQKQVIFQVLKEKPSYFVREGVVQDLLKRFAGSDKAVLEIGCGAGELARVMMREGYKDIHLVDIDNYLPDDVKGRISLSLLDVCFNPLPLGDSSIDIILAIAIIEHLENPFLIVRESVRVLKKDGVCIIAIPHIFSLRSKFSFLLKGDLMSYNETNNHISYFTKSVFKKIFLKHFDIVETKYSKGYVRIFGKKLKSRHSPVWFDRFFGDKLLLVLKKKS